jgi:hypothetical protein
MAKFKYDPSETMEENWERYSTEVGLNVVTTKAQQKAHNKKRLAFHKKYVNLGFQKHFGRDDEALEGWRGICDTLGMSDAESFTTVNHCKKVCLLRVHLL